MANFIIELMGDPMKHARIIPSVHGVGGLFHEVTAYPGCTQYQQRALSHKAINMAAMGDFQPVRLQCDFIDFEHCKAIECGVYRFEVC